MTARLIHTLIALCCLLLPAKAQTQAVGSGAEAAADSVRHTPRPAYTQLYEPVIKASYVLLPGAALTLAAKPLDRDAYQNREHYWGGYRHSWDDYTTVLPLAASWGLALAGARPGYSQSKQEMAVLQLATLGLSTAITLGGKYSFRRLRPDASARNSFPSGHSSLAFASATLLSMEYGERYPYLPPLAYTLASATALGRIANKRHWLTDVLSGATVGIFSTRLVYAVHSYLKGRGPLPDIQRTDELDGYFISFKMGLSSIYGYKASEKPAKALSAAKLFGCRLRLPLYKQWGLSAEGSLIDRQRTAEQYLQGFALNASLSYLMSLSKKRPHWYAEGLLGLGYLSASRLTDPSSGTQSRAYAWPTTAPAIFLKPELALMYRSSRNTLLRLYASAYVAPTAMDYSRLSRKGETGAELGVAVEWAW